MKLDQIIEAASNTVGAKWGDGGNVYTLRVYGNKKIGLVNQNGIAIGKGSIMFNHNGIGHAAQGKMLSKAIFDAAPSNDDDLVQVLKDVTKIKGWKPLGK